MNCSSSTSGGSYFDSMGFRFRPIDEELISYLLKFMCSKPIECDNIRMLDLYGNKKPCDIFDDLSPDGEFTDVNYLFTQLTKKSTGGKNIKRTVLGGGGTWKGLDKGKEVMSKKGSVIGLKRSFHFIDSEKSNHQRVVWNMKEYSLSDSIVKALRRRNQIRHEGFVLCRIKKKVVVRSNDPEQVIYNCQDEEIGGNNIRSTNVVADQEQIMLGLGYVGVDDQNHGIGNPEEGFCDGVNVHGDDQMMNGFHDSVYFQGNQMMNVFCATCDYDKEEIIGSSSHHQEQNYHIGSSCVTTSCNEFELLEVDEQEYERAKSNVALLEEKMSELSSIVLQGNDDDYNQ
ncbi:hypothetical protein P3L10_018446 [Capsicum annuum]